MRIKIIHEPGDELFISRPMAIGLAACLLIAIIACSITANMPIPHETAEATYKGHMIKGEESYYPIVEVDGVEYTSIHSQPVRDSGYIGETVTISYREGNMQDFVIEWEAATP